MLNQTGVNKVSFGAPEKPILVDERNSTSFSVVVDATGVSADSDGNKIIKAGTPMYGSLEARNTAFVVATQTAAAGDNPASNNATCLLLHDVDVTGLTGGATRNAQVLVFGFVDLNKLDTAVQSMITAEVKANLRMIQFVK